MLIAGPDYYGSGGQNQIWRVTMVEYVVLGPIVGSDLLCLAQHSILLLLTDMLGFEKGSCLFMWR